MLKTTSIWRIGSVAHICDAALQMCLTDRPGLCMMIGAFKWSNVVYDMRRAIRPTKAPQHTHFHLPNAEIRTICPRRPQALNLCTPPRLTLYDRRILCTFKTKSMAHIRLPDIHRNAITATAMAIVAATLDWTHIHPVDNMYI